MTTLQNIQSPCDRWQLLIFTFIVLYNDWFIVNSLNLLYFSDSSISPIIKCEAKSSTNKYQSSSDREASDYYQSNHDRNDVSISFIYMLLELFKVSLFRQTPQSDFAMLCLPCFLSKWAKKQGIMDELMSI